MGTRARLLPGLPGSRLKAEAPRGEMVMETEVKEGPEPGGGLLLGNVGSLEPSALCWGKLRLRNKKGQVKAT